MKFQNHIIPSLLSLLLVACHSDSDDEINCTDDVVPGIAITVIDDVTEEVISCGATVILQDSDYEEEITDTSSSCNASTQLLGAYEREGFYNITVRKDGYEYWYAYDIEVSADICHVQQVSIEARLTPL